MKETWFQTWDRPEYVEYAKPTDYGYLLIIGRKQPENWLLGKAKLIFEREGFPAFEILERKTVNTEEEATTRLDEWKSEAA